MNTDQLLDRVAQGHSSASTTLLTLHRQQLHQMVKLRIDPRLAARLDPSDIVQDALAEAHQRLPDYVANRPIPFYPWLRKIAWDRLVQMYRHHIKAQRRSVLREDLPPLSAESEMLLAEQLATSSTPSDQLLHREMGQRVRQAIVQLPAGDREVIVLKHLEELSFPDAAAVLEINIGAVYSRYYRAIRKMHQLLNES